MSRPAFPPVVSPAPGVFELWRDALRLRPLLWVAPCVAGGGAFGFQIGALLEAGILEASTSAERRLIFALLLGVALGFLALSFFRRGKHGFASRVAFGAFTVCAMSVYAAWRVLPPPGDISEFIREDISRQRPLKARVLTLRGYVADHPRRGEFGVEFPLQCVERDDASAKSTRVPARGRVWVTAPPDADIAIGDAVQVQGELRPVMHATNPGQRDGHWRRVLERCWCELRVRDKKNWRALRASPDFNFERNIAAWRQAIFDRYVRAFQEQSTPYPHAKAQLLAAMTFGEGGLIVPLPRQVREQFRAAGLSHVLVASGTQIAFLCALLIGLGRVLGLRRGWLLALVIPALLFYATLAGGAPAIGRATVVGILVCIAILAGRDVDGLSLWSLALIVLTLLDPLQLLSLSFQLSFGATWGLLALAPVLRKKFKSAFGSGTIVDLTAFSLGAQLGVLPILLYHFGRISLAGVGANLLGVPLAGVLVATGIAGLLLPLAWLNELIVSAVANVAGFFAALPGAQVERPPLRLLWTLLCYAMLIGAILLPASAANFQNGLLWALRAEVSRWWKRRRQQLPCLQNVFVFAIFAVTVWAGWQFWQAREQPLRLTMLDVGQGESLVVRSPRGRVVLVDGGSDAQGARSNVGAAVIVPYLQSLGVARVDVLVITHADADHCNGLLNVLREVPVGLVLDGVAVADPLAVEYQELRREIARRKIRRIIARAGQLLHLDGATLRVLAPLSPAFAEDNNNSLVLRLDYGQTSFLLTGDIESEAEERLVRRGAPLRCTILKAAHHGSQTSSSALFLRVARPQAAIVSCGRYNRFKHPSAVVLARLQQQKVPVFRTDLDGAIEITSDGRRCWMQTMR